MKKIIAAIFSVILTLSISLTAFAAGAAEVALNASTSRLKQGATVTVSVSIKNSDAFKSMGLTFTYDKNIFEFVSGEWTLPDALLSDANADTAAVALKSATDRQGEVFKLTLKAKEDAPIASQIIKIGYVAKNGSAEVAGGSAQTTVKIVCKAHNLSNWSVTKAPTCELSGKQERKCTVSGCDFTEAADISALGHKYGSWVVIKAATCTEKGSKQSVCATCGKAKTEATAVIGHNFETPILVKEATISSTGLMEGKCKNCGSTTSQIIPCGAKDEKAGISFETSEGVFASGTVISTEVLTEGSSKYSAVAEALQEVSGKLKAFNIKATLNGSEVNPNGIVKTTFNIPEGFGKNVAVYSIASDGTKQTVESLLSEDGKTVTAEISQLGTYAVCDLDELPQVIQPDAEAPADANPTDEKASNDSVWLIIAAIIVIIAIALVIIVITKKKKADK